MADGFDGFEALTGRKFLVDHETGTSISNIIRSFLLGSAYIMRKKQLVEDAEVAEAEHATHDHSQPIPSSGAPATPARAQVHAEKCELTDVGPDGVSPANGYFGTKTPLVLKKHRERAARSPAASPRASLAGKTRKPANEVNARPIQNTGVIDVAVEPRGHMPGGDYNVKTGEPEPASSLVQVNEVEVPTKDALLDGAQPEEPGHMPGGTENLFDPPAPSGAAASSQGPAQGQAQGQASGQQEDAVVEGEEVQETNWETLRHHVVQHDWTFIKEAIYLAKHEHMSDVDRFKGDLMRRIQAGVSTAPTPARTPTPAPTPGLSTTESQGWGVNCDDKCKLEIQGLDNDLAIVSPLVDGRLRDASGKDGL